MQAEWRKGAQKVDTARACPGGPAPPRTCEFLPRPCPLTFSDRDSDSHERQNHQNCRNRELPGEARRGRKLWGTGSAGNRWGRGPLGVRPERRGCSGDPCASPGLGPALPGLAAPPWGEAKGTSNRKGKRDARPPFQGRLPRQHRMGRSCHRCQHTADSAQVLGLPNSDPPNSQASRLQRRPLWVAG